MEGRARVLSAISPLLLATFVVGSLRLALLTTGAAEDLVRLFSLTGIQLIGVFYVPLRLSFEPEARFVRIWAAFLILFGFSQAFYASGVLLAFANDLLPQYPHLLADTGAAPIGLRHVLAHVWFHFKLWVAALPLLLAAAASLLLALARRFLPLEEA